MRITDPRPFMDAVAEPQDVVEVEVQETGPEQKVLYVHVNGVTVLRIGKVSQLRM